MTAAAQAWLPGRRRPHIITVASGKGGVGKTSLVANLGLELTRHGAAVVLVEGDSELRDLSCLLNLGPPDDRGRGDDLDIEVTPTLRLIPVQRRATALARLAEPAAAGDVDFVLIDTGSGIGPPVLELIGLAARTLVVTTHEPTAVAAAYALFQASCQRGSTRLDVVLNMAVSHQAARETHGRLSNLTEYHLGIRPALVAVIPRDEAVGAAVMRREPMTLIFPYARATRAVAALAITLLGTEGNHHERSRIPLAVRDRW
jgi:flagellar biosynthesis protein FlhG